MFAKGISSVVSEAKQNISDADILYHYLGITKIPTIINSPLRQDKKPSFGLFSFDGNKIFYRDFATRDSGSIISLFQKMWNLSYNDTWKKIVNDLHSNSNIDISKSHIPIVKVSTKRGSGFQIVVRDWKQCDIDYWKQYGISIEWLEFADVHPISNIIFKKDNKKSVVPADECAYAFVEFKENKTTYKIYQPLNTNGFKWLNSHDGSVISLWTKLPERADKIVICSSLKDALCLWANTGIPAIAPQGEGYGLSEHSINDLKTRFKQVFILLDNDKPGLADSEKMSKQTGFTNIILPQFEGGKDISDFYKSLNNKKQFKKEIIKLFQND